MSKGQRGVGGGLRSCWVVVGQMLDGSEVGSKMAAAMSWCRSLHRAEWPDALVFLPTALPETGLVQLTSDFCEFARAAGFSTVFMPAGKSLAECGYADPSLVVACGSGGCGGAGGAEGRRLMSGVVSRATEKGIRVVEVSLGQV